MAIVYLPSEGNVSKVSINEDGLWFGESIGGGAVESIRTNTLTNRSNYYVDKYADLSSESSWFYKDATDYNFLNGVTLYRALYIGADSKATTNEILGLIEASVSHNGPSDVDNSLQVDIIYDGKYTALTSQNSTILKNEQDTTGVLSSRTDWASSYTSSEVLSPGQYLKFWIRLRYTQDADLRNFVNYNYYVTIKDLTIPILRTNGRLNFSKVFSLGSLSQASRLELKAALPEDFSISNVYKVIEKDGRTNIFYFDADERLKLLIIHKSSVIEENKYIVIDLTRVTSSIVLDNTFYENFSECCGVSPTSGTPITGSGTSGTSGTSGDPCVMQPLSSEYDDLIGTKYLVDIFSTEKSDRNQFYLFFNTFLTDTTNEFIERYGHKNYYWNTGLISINLNNVNESFFTNVEAGYENRRTIVLTNQYEAITVERFYTKNVILQDDLFTGIGFIPEDCRVENNRNKIWNLWEGDIVNRVAEVQLTRVPQVESNELFTVPPKVSNEIDLIFTPTMVDTVEFDWTRSKGELLDGTEYVKMGAPHQKRFDHGYSSVSYDIDREIDEFSSTWSFGVNTGSIVLATTTPTTSCSTTATPITSAPTTSTPAVSGADPLNPNQFHVVLESDVGTESIAVEDLDFLNESVGVFNIHCNGSQTLSAVKANYNWSTRVWTLLVNDEEGDQVSITIDDGPDLATTYENVITVNVLRQIYYGCFKKYLVQYSVHVNGEELINGTTYTDQTVDSYVVTHNYEEDFSGWVSYWEVRNYLQEEAIPYAIGMFKILSNISWAELETEVENSDNNITDFKQFNYRRSILINNLGWEQPDSIVFPIVLQGTGYNIGTTYNQQVRRSVFDFSKIDINNPSFAFVLEGTTTKLDWYASTFDVDKDIMVIWVKLSKWNGQRLTMYYSDSRIIGEEKTVEPYVDDYYAAWHMEDLITIPRKRYVDQTIFEGGESMVLTVDDQNQESLVHIDRQYLFGKANLYKSNQFDIEWNDLNSNRENTEAISAFIKESGRQFKPNYMEIRNAKTMFPYKLESSSNAENGRDSNINSDIIGGCN